MTSLRAFFWLILKVRTSGTLSKGCRLHSALTFMIITENHLPKRYTNVHEIPKLVHICGYPEKTVSLNIAQ